MISVPKKNVNGRSVFALDSKAIVFDAEVRLHAQTVQARRARAEGPSASAFGFGLQMREKSKVKLAYGIDETKLSVLHEAVASKKALSSTLVEFSSGVWTTWSSGSASRRRAAQPASSCGTGHIIGERQKVVSPGFEVRAKTWSKVREGSIATGAIAKRKEVSRSSTSGVARLDPVKLEGQVLTLPAEVEAPFEINLLVEAFSK